MLSELLLLINTVLSNRGKKTIDSISVSTDLRKDLGFDSLDLAELTVRIEDKYDIDIFENGIVATIGEILQQFEK
ncbi:MAG: phosphopantetheine-binding protein [Bacteroidetes bacterium]|nr:phosphopantetheine-binding protein [Bacteroidota bacterium]